MAEYHDRCRYYPHCRIHQGQLRPHFYSPENKAEMWLLRSEGWQLDEIAEAFDTRPTVVGTLLEGKV